MKKIVVSLMLFGAFFQIANAQEGYKVGDTAEDFSLIGTDDKMHSLSDFKEAKGFIVIFTCNHCPYSVAYEDRIIALQAKYQSQGYEVIAINPNNPEAYESDNFENMKIRAREKGFTFPYLADPEKTIFPKYGATKTPHVFLLDADKKVQYIGSIDNATSEKKVTIKYLEDAIEALKKGETPPVTFTKAIGCSIKL